MNVCLDIYQDTEWVVASIRAPRYRMLLCINPSLLVSQAANEKGLIQ
jgi:hypothetical protein